MNKKIFFKLGLFLLSLSLVACGQANNSTTKDNSAKLSTLQVANSTEKSVKKSVQTTSPATENTAKSQQATEQNPQPDIKSDIDQEAKEQEYYDILKKAWQKELDYINSIDDPKVKQSVQTPESAAIMESTGLLMEHPEDSEAINASLKKVLAGE